MTQIPQVISQIVYHLPMSDGNVSVFIFIYLLVLMCVQFHLQFPFLDVPL